MLENPGGEVYESPNGDTKVIFLEESSCRVQFDNKTIDGLVSLNHETRKHSVGKVRREEVPPELLDLYTLLQPTGIKFLFMNKTFKLRALIED